MPLAEPLRLAALLIDMRFIALIMATLCASACGDPSVPLPTAENAGTRTGGAPAQAAAPAQPVAATPSPPPPRESLTDAAITRKIRDALLADPALAGADVSVNTDHGVVVLAGTVSSHEQSGVASAHAQRQDGVMRVDNQLRLALS